MNATVVKLLAAALLLATAASALAGVHYVDVNGTNATPPYTNWTTAATNIQDAVDAAEAGDQVVVTNGIYATGGRTIDGITTNRVAVDKPLNVRSVNGPQFTTISGGGVRCVYMTNSTSLSGFTLSNGSAGYGGGAVGGTLTYCNLEDNAAYYNGSNSVLTDGGGAYGCTLNNCTLSRNQALNYVSCSCDASGGGASYCTLNNCTLSRNYVYFWKGGTGGGAAHCTLNNCTLTLNSAGGDSVIGGGPGAGGGAYQCTLNNCALLGNSAGSGAGGTVNRCMLNNCIFYGSENDYYMSTFHNSWFADPLFVDLAAGNLRLQPNSPCINAGNNSYVTNATDLDGNPRISGGTVDIGAYEYQWPQLTIAPSGPNVLLTWPTNNAGYDYTGFSLQSTTNLYSSAIWSSNSPAPVVIAGQNTVTNSITGARQFFRLVQ
jgi:hypothetical protein